MKTIQEIRLYEMSEAVLSYVKVKYKERADYSISEEYGTIQALCAKYQIIRRKNREHFYAHLMGKKCKVVIKNGATIFEGYY